MGNDSLETGHPVLLALGKIILAWVAWLGSLSLQQWGTLVGLLAGVLAMVFTGLQTYVLWRDKVARYRPPDAKTRVTDVGDLS